MNKRYFTLLIIALSLNLRPAITSVGPLLSIIKNDLTMGNVSASLLTTFPVFFMGAASIFSIYLSRKLQVEGALMIALSFIFIALSSRLFVSTSFGLIVTALLAGIGIGISAPLIIGLIKKYYPNESMLMSFYSCSMVAGAAIASTFAFPIYEKFDSSWHIALSCWGLLALLAAILLLPTLVTNKVITPEKEQSNNTIRKNNYWLMWFFASMAAIFYSLTAWLAPFVQTIGFSTTESGLLLSTFTLIQLPVSFIVPRLAQNSQSTKKSLLICSFSELLGILLMVLGVSPWLFVIFLAIGAGGLFPLALTLPLILAKNSNEVIHLSTFMQSGGFMIGSLGPLIFGWVSQQTQDFNASWSFLILIIFFMLFSIRQIFRKTSS